MERMDNAPMLADHFEAHRGHLRGVAYRMLGSLHEADDAVQEAWLRFSRAGINGVENIGGWLTTIVARVCLDMLRTRKARREDALDDEQAERVVSRAACSNPEDEAILADSVGLALLVVLETLAPAERLAFVLHDLFGLPFDEIAPIVERSPDAARQLASRARRRVRGGSSVADADLTRTREVVDAFLAAARRGDFDALLAVLDPDVVQRADQFVMQMGAPREIRGAIAVATRAKGGARGAQSALVNGSVGVVVAPRGQLVMVLRPTIINGKITEIEVIADPEHLRTLEVATFDD
jgi:RNA polymerase sigma-70 factor (ECF subfamily)